MSIKHIVVFAVCDQCGVKFRLDMDVATTGLTSDAYALATEMIVSSFGYQDPRGLTGTCRVLGEQHFCRSCPWVADTR